MCHAYTIISTSFREELRFGRLGNVMSKALQLDERNRQTRGFGTFEYDQLILQR